MRKNNKVLIIGHLDGLANSVRPKVIKEFLKKNGYDVKLFDDNSKAFLRAKEGLKAVLRRRVMKKSALDYYQKYPFIEDKKAFAETVLLYLAKEKYRAIICTSHASPYVFTRDIDALKIYDCPTPVTFEIKYGYELYKRSMTPERSSASFFAQFYPLYIRELEKKELEIYKSVDYLSFHWESYAEYIRKHFYRGDNLFVLNWGCHTGRKKAKWNNVPRIVFAGNLKGYWVNHELLSFLMNMSPYAVDCYGNLKPGRHSGLHVKGFLSDLDILSQYQFGLVALKKDKLKQFGFSAKVLDYVSYGLPSLLPKWFTIRPKIEGCIYYDESNIISLIETYLDKKRWKKYSCQAYEYAQGHSWNRTLKPLLVILEKHLR